MNGAHIDQWVSQSYGPPTWKVKLPSVVWVSTESTCQRTL
jgi:hypothetical protein